MFTPDSRDLSNQRSETPALLPSVAANDPSHSTDVCSTTLRALGKIKEYSSRNLEEIISNLSEREAEIAKAMNAIAGRAKELLVLADRSTDSPTAAQRYLLSVQDELLAAQEGQQTLHLDDFHSPTDALHYANAKLFEALSQGAQSGEEVVEIRAFDLAIMVTEAALLEDSIRTRYQGSGPFKQHREIMRGALACNGPSTTIEEAFVGALEAKCQHLGYLPSLTVVHDKDGNLVDGENSPLKPGAVVGQLVDKLDGFQKIPSYQRIVLGDNLDRVPGHGSLAQEMFQYAGASTHKMFGDAALLFDETKSDPSIKHVVLTANMREYARGFIGREGVEIRGKTADSYISEMKPESLLDMVLRDPTRIFIMSDNADESLSRAVREGFEVGDETLKIEEAIFFASRVAGPSDAKDHLLAHTLREAAIPFAENQVRVTEEGSYEGYEGVTSLVSTYQRWRAEKIEQGWPISPTQSKVQHRLHDLLVGSDEALSELSQRWKAEEAVLLTQLQEQLPTGVVDSQLLRDCAYKAQRNAELRQEIGGVTSFLASAREEYEELTKDLALNDKRRPVIATRLLRDALQAASDTRGAGASLETKEVEVVGGVRISIIDLPKVDLNSLNYHVAQHLESKSLDPDSLDLVLIKTKEGGDTTLVVPLSMKGMLKAESIRGATDLGEGAYLLGESFGRNDTEQERNLRKELRRDITIAELYYRNAFAMGGGLEKTIREQAKVFADAGFRVRLVGGNDPDVSSYDPALISTFEHRTIPLLHERNQEILQLASSLYEGEIPPQFDTLYREVKEELKQALAGVDFVIVHNPLFLRNPLLQKALLDLKREDALGGAELVGWVHDIGIYTEPEKYPREFSDESPWGYVGKIHPGIHYVPVSAAVSKKLHTVPRAEEATSGSYTFGTVVPPGSDYQAMLPSGRVAEALLKTINWDDVESLWVTPGRIAERKNTLGAIHAIGFNPGSYLVITGKPKVERLADGSERINDPYYEEVKATVEELGLRDRVIFLHTLVGEISDREYERTLAELASLADGGLTVPFEEGFGIDPRNLALVSGVIVSSDDEALRGNLSDTAHYVSRQGHPLEVAAAMRAELKQNPHIGLRQKARTTESWASRLQGTIQYFDEKSVSTEALK